MKKKSPLFAVLATVVALLALPAAAGAEYLIPNGNSAVNQYTEGIPTGGGEKDAKGAGEKKVKPAQTIGAKTTRELEEKGPEGEALAEVAAETAPPDVAVEETSGGGKSDDKDSGNKDEKEQNGSGDANGETEAGQSGGATPPGGSGPGGSGGFGEIVAAATGSSDGGVGLLLPLAIVGALIWGIAFAWRKRDSERTATTQS